MAAHRFFCCTCGAEFLDAAPLTAGGWHAGDCSTCGRTVVVWSRPVPCPECGIEFQFESTGAGAELPVAKCPTCGVTVAIARDFPSPPDGAEEGKSERRPRPVPAARDAEGTLSARSMVVALVAIIYVIACFLPTIRLDRQSQFMPGYVCLLLGWVLCCLWFPNPLLLGGCLALVAGRNRLAFVLGVLACLCTIPFFVGDGPTDMLANLTLGFYFWQSDIVLFTISAGIFFARHGVRSCGSERNGTGRPPDLHAERLHGG